MSDQIYEISHDMGDDVQASWVAMYRDRFPQRHRIDEIDDEVTRGISRWVREEDGRESDTHVDLLEEPKSYFEQEDLDTNG
ncbi:hypothetical protein [Nonomuraea lactucae]|uniref:hypothetical protein n=1 Tax=Nonomuraea lactucae TaxID=2249762 RepID=UPI0013B428AB|nr:hypothetical protein [Nonomuraea lactucae]